MCHIIIFDYEKKEYSMNENLSAENHSSRFYTFTRVKPHKRQAEITIGITLSPHLLAEARIRNLNISRICEQALSSIIDYLPPKNEAESSPVLDPCSFQENGEGRGRDLNPGARLHRPIGYQATSPRPLFE
jgi:hypothetical protein